MSKQSRKAIVTLIVVIGLSYLGGRLMTDMMANQVAHIETERLATHLRLVFRGVGSEVIWKDPRSPEAAEIFKQIRDNPMLIKTERLRKFKIWDGDGKLIWPRPKFSDDKTYHYKKERITPKNTVTFEFGIPGHDEKGDKKYKADTILETYVPIWQEGKDRLGRPDLIAEVYTEPRFLFEQIKGGWNILWMYTAVLGVIIYVVLLTALL